MKLNSEKTRAPNRGSPRIWGERKTQNETFLVENYKKLEKYFVFGKFVCYFAP